ncbi:MAG: valine--tRNA ligase, partial [Halanaerobiales bacterium]
KGAGYIKDLAGIGELNITEKLTEKPKKASTTIVNEVEVILPLEGMVDLDKEIERLENKLDEIESEIKRAEGKLATDGFVNKAPKDLVEAERQKLKEYKNERQKVKQRLLELKD